MNDIEKYFEYAEKEGLSGLLPQNMPDYILYRMLDEIGAIDTNSDDTPASTLLLAVLSIHSGEIITKDGGNNMSVNFEPPKELMEKFENYKLSLSIEHMQRIKKISISANSLPTLDNILNSDREVEVSIIT